MDKVLSRTQSEAMDKGCLLGLSMPSAWLPAALEPSLLLSLEAGAVAPCGDTLLPAQSQPRWELCCLCELTRLSWLELSQDLSAPRQSVTQQLPTAGQIPAMLQGSEDLSVCTRALLCTSALNLCTAWLWPPLAHLLRARCCHCELIDLYLVQCHP